MPPYYYALIRLGGNRAVAFYVGKGIDPSMDRVELLLNYPRLMAFTMWYGRFPEIISEYELEEMIEHGTEVITLYPEGLEW